MSDLQPLPFFTLLAILLLTVVLGVGLDQIHNDLRRANDIECVKLQNDGTDSFSSRDRRACPPEMER